MSKSVNDAFNEIVYSSGYDNNVEIVSRAIEDLNTIKKLCEDYGHKFDLVTIREALFTLAQLKGDHGSCWKNYNDKIRALELIKKECIGLLNFYYDDEHDFGEVYAFNGKDEVLIATAYDKEEYELLKRVLL